MSKKLFEETNIQNIANAIREKNGAQDSYTVAQMASVIRNIKTPPNLESLNATENGDYTPSYGKDGFSTVHVDVEAESHEAVIQPLSVTQNGTYTPPSGVDGYAPVNVNVPSGGGGASTDFDIGDPIIPTMTSNTSPSGQVSRSSCLSNNYEAFRAFNKAQADGMMQQGWLAASNDAEPFIQYVWDTPTSCGIVIIDTANNSTTVSRTVTVEGLTQNDEWENCLASGSSISLDFIKGTYGNNCKHYVILLNNRMYKGIRISGNENFYGGTNQYACTFSEIQVYGEHTGLLPGLGYYGIDTPLQSFGENGNIYTDITTNIVYKKRNGIWESLYIT